MTTQQISRLLASWEKNRRKMFLELQSPGETRPFWGNGLWSRLVTLEVETTYEQSNRLGPHAQFLTGLDRSRSLLEGPD